MLRNDATTTKQNRGSRSLATSILILASCLTSLAAQTPAETRDRPQAATAISRAEILAVLGALSDSDRRVIDQQVRVVDIGAGTNVAVGVLQRDATHTEGAAVRGLVHHEVTEVYYVLDGSGILVTGGTTQVLRAIAPDSTTVTELVGPSSSATSTGGTHRRIAAGDVVVIPAGTFHGFSEIERRIRYLSIRVDPHHVLPSGYANPALPPSAPP